MIVGVDIDEVLFPFIDQFRGWLVEHHGRTPESLPTPTAWNMDEAWGFSEHEWWEVFAEAVHAGLFLEGEPMPGAVDGLGRLLDAGHEVVLVTARIVHGAEAKARQDTFRWVADLGVPVSGLFITNDKGSIETDLFIDDAYHHYVALDEEGETFPVVMSHPWNRRFGDVRRVDGWVEFTEAVTFLCAAIDGSDDHPQFVMRDAWEMWGEEELDPEFGDDDYEFDVDDPSAE